MDKTNSKTLTLAFAIIAAVVAFTVHMLLKSFGAAFGIVARLTDSDLVRHGGPILVGVIVFSILQFNPKVLTWADEVVTEIKKVVWPSRKETVAMTLVVCVMVMISSVIISAFDFVSGYLVKMLIN